MSWISGPCNPEPRNTEEPDDEEQVDQDRWYRRMAASGAFWTELNWGHFDRSRDKTAE